jgi:hypothetical protein
MQTKSKKGMPRIPQVRIVHASGSTKIVERYLQQRLPKTFFDRHQLSLSVFPYMRALGYDLYPILRTFEINARQKGNLELPSVQHKRLVMYFSLFPSLKDKALDVFETLAPEWEALFEDFQSVSKWLKDLVHRVNARDTRAPISEQVNKYLQHLTVTSEENYALVLPYALQIVFGTDLNGHLPCEPKERGIVHQLLHSPFLSKDTRELIILQTNEVLATKLRAMLVGVV